VTRTIVPDVVDRTSVATLGPKTTVAEAANVMTMQNIGAVLIMEDEVLIGIVTERDFLTKVLAKGLRPTETLLGDIMTKDPDRIGPNESVLVALERMQVGGYRHLPVVDEDEVVAIISMRDAYAAVRTELSEALQELEAFLAAPPVRKAG
jgi:CBS domain-containing protein